MEFAEMPGEGDVGRKRKHLYLRVMNTVKFNGEKQVEIFSTLNLKHTVLTCSI